MTLAGELGARIIVPMHYRTVMRTLGGALGGQLSATFIANNVAHGLPTSPGSPTRS